MNKLVLRSPKLFFDDNHHPMCNADFGPNGGNANFLVDTGFSLGFAFSEDVQKMLRFKDGYYVSMLLGNGRVTKGIVFPIDLFVISEQKEISCGQTSVVFMNRKGDPLIGVEALRLWSPLSLDWKTNSFSASICIKG